MLFNSLSFLVFFPLVTLVYFLIPHKIRWIWLLAASYYFYMSWNPHYAFLMGASTLITWLSGLLIDRENCIEDKTQRTRRKKVWVALSFIINLAILFLFKYFNFAASSVVGLFSLVGITVSIPAFDLLLPVGISFYTFQALSYTADVYRGEIYAERNLGKYALFVSFFPQLVAGPIERSKNLLVQINEKHTFEYMRVKNGLLRMLWGLFEKMVVADRVAIVVNTVYGSPESFGGMHILLATVLFAVQIYCDFSGYSDIAIGAAQVMGFRLMDNFHQPYFATSVRDFWRRWHISLSTWFRDYLYIPLGGSRCSTAKKYRNVFLTFLLSGLWHGANWNFAIWGALHGLYQIIGDIIKKPKHKLYAYLGVPSAAILTKIGQAVCTFLLVDFAWIFFRSTDGINPFHIIGRMFTQFNWWALFDGSLLTMGLSGREFNVMLVAIFILFFVDYLRTRVPIRQTLAQQFVVYRWVIYYLLAGAILLFGVFGQDYAQTQFIYFQF